MVNDTPRGVSDACPRVRHTDTPPYCRIRVLEDVSTLISKDPSGVLQNCLVGKWREVPEPRPSVKEVESWAKTVWRLKGEVLIAFLHG